MSEPDRARVRVSAQSALGMTTPRSDALELPDVYVRSLIRSQLGLAVVCLLAFVVLTVLLVLGVYAVPGLAGLQLAGMPASWLVLGLGVYPIIWVTALIYARAASRNERSYLDLTDSDSPKQ